MSADVRVRVAMRPLTPRLFSNTVTLWPACARVRAQVMPAMPAPTTAIWLRGRGADLLDAMACLFSVKVLMRLLYTLCGEDPMPSSVVMQFQQCCSRVGVVKLFQPPLQRPALAAARRLPP